MDTQDTVETLMSDKGRGHWRIVIVTYDRKRIPRKYPNWLAYRAVEDAMQKVGGSDNCKELTITRYET